MAFSSSYRQRSKASSSNKNVYSKASSAPITPGSSEMTKSSLTNYMRVIKKPSQATTIKPEKKIQTPKVQNSDSFDWGSEVEFSPIRPNNGPTMTSKVNNDSLKPGTDQIDGRRKKENNKSSICPSSIPSKSTVSENQIKSRPPESIESHESMANSKKSGKNTFEKYIETAKDEESTPSDISELNLENRSYDAAKLEFGSSFEIEDVQLSSVESSRGCDRQFLEGSSSPERKTEGQSATPTALEISSQLSSEGDKSQILSNREGSSHLSMDEVENLNGKQEINAEGKEKESKGGEGRMSTLEKRPVSGGEQPPSTPPHRQSTADAKIETKNNSDNVHSSYLTSTPIASSEGNIKSKQAISQHAPPSRSTGSPPLSPVMLDRISNGSNSKMDLIDEALHQENLKQPIKRPSLNLDESQPSETDLMLSNWDLPAEVINYYKRKGITKLFPWQYECLNLPGVLDGGNLVYAAPTSAGKTMITDILMLPHIMKKKKVIIVQPYNSVTREKMTTLNSMFKKTTYRVGGFYGVHVPPGGIATVDIAVCTIEKAHNLITRLAEEGKLDRIGMIAIDELHLIGEGRGMFLELMLTKVLYYCKTRDIQIQLVGMSATLPNFDDLANWLQAQAYQTDFRPVPLKELVKIDSLVLNPKDMSTKFKIEPGRYKLPTGKKNPDPNHLVDLTLGIVENGHSVLVFAPTKKEVLNIAMLIAETCYLELREGNENLKNHIKLQKLESVKHSLRSSPAGLDPDLAKCITFGVGFHHAGLTNEEKEVIEDAYKGSWIKVIVATTTLSAGVNLPGRRVIITSPMNHFNQERLDVATYRQMVGRAGRMGVDTEGESILIARKNEKKDKQNAMWLTRAQIPPARSCIFPQDSLLNEPTPALKRALVEIVTSGLATNLDEISTYFSSTFYKAQNPSSLQEEVIQKCCEILEREEILQHLNVTRKITYYPTQLAKAINSSSISVEEGRELLSEILGACQHFVLATDLQIIYHIIPLRACLSFLPKGERAKAIWERYRDVIMAKSRENVTRDAVIEVLKIKSGFVERFNQSPSLFKSDNKEHQKLIRFYAALAFNDLVNEVPLAEVVKDYHIEKGALQTMQSNMSSLAGMVAAFCNKLGYHNLELLIKQFEKRLHYAVKFELLDLMRVSDIIPSTARALFRAGITTLRELADSEPALIEMHLNNHKPFASEPTEEAKIFMADHHEAMPIKRAACLLIQEARRLVEQELGVEIPEWKTNETPSLEQGANLSNAGDALTNMDEELIENAHFNKISDPLPKKNKVRDSWIESNASKKPKKEIPESMTQDSNENAVSLGSDFESPGNESQFGDCLIDRITQESLREANESPHPYDSGDELEDEFEQPICKVNEESPGNAARPLVGEDAYGPIPSTSLMAPSANPEARTVSCKRKDPNTSTAIDLAPSKKVAKKGPFSDSDDSPIQDTASTSDILRTPEKRKSMEKVIANEGSPTPPKQRLCNSEELSNFQTPNRPPSYSSKRNSRRMRNSVETPVSSASKSAETSGLRSKSFSRDLSLDFPSMDERDGQDDKKHVSSEENDTASEISSSSDSSNSSSEEDFIPSGALKPIHSLDDIAFENFSHLRSSQRNAKWNEFKAKFSSSKIIAMHIRFKERHPPSSTHKIGPRSKTKSPKQTLQSPTFSLKEAYIGFGDGIVYHISSDLTPKDLFEDFSENFKNYFSSDPGTVLLAYNVIETYLSLRRIFKMSESALRNFKWFEPAAAFWMLDPEHELLKEATSIKRLPSIIEKFKVVANGMNNEEIVKFCADFARLLCAKHDDCRYKGILLLYPLMEALKSQLKVMAMWKTYRDTEMPVRLILAEMEFNGIGVDYDYIYNLQEKVKEQRGKIESECLAIVRKECQLHNFNIRSPSVVSKILFTNLGLGQKALDMGIKLKKTEKQKQYKTDQESLAKIKDLHPLVKKIIIFRKLDALMSRGVEPIMQFVCYDERLAMYRIAGKSDPFTATGRVVMDDPNLIGLAKSFSDESDSLELELSQEFLSPEDDQYSIRNGFIPKRGSILVSADYAQLELRLMAHLSKDKELIEVLDSGQDVFKSIAAKWKEKSIKEISDDERQQAKQICYGILYGMGARTLSEKLKVTYDEAKEFKETFLERYKQLQIFIRDTKVRCEELGYVETLLGRRRYFPSINSTDSMEKSSAERAAVNTAIQGTAADLVKMAMNVLKKSYLSPSATLVMQLYDELIYEVPEDEADDFILCLRKSMETCSSKLGLRVRMPVQIKKGSTWGGMQPI